VGFVKVNSFDDKRTCFFSFHTLCVVYKLMKNYLSLIFFFCLSYLHLFADTYVWEDYDDFSGSSLDTNKWGTMYFYGGDKPVISTGQVKFSSSGKSNSASSEFKQGWDSSAFIDYTEEAPGSVLYVKDASIYGIEAFLTLPSGSSAKTAICLQVGSLNSYGQHIAELMNDSGNGPSFWIHDYVADTGISTESSNENTFKVTLIHDNQKNIFYINDIKVHELDASNFTPDWFGINTFENNGQAYNVYADNVRVLRRATTTSLDGSTYSLSSADGVSETLVFSNGTFTSTFTDPEEGEIVTTDQSYILDQISEDEFRIILGDGDTMEFNTATNSGKLTDYDSSGQIDTSGTWEFTFETTSTPSQSYAPSSIAGRMITYTGNGETETASFSADGIVTDGEDWTFYEYEKTSDNVGVVTYTFANETNPAPEVETLTFTSSSGGTYDWIEYSDSSKSTPIDQGSGQFTISASFAPQSLEGYSLKFDENETSPNIVQYGTSSKYFSSTVAIGTEEGLPESVPYTYSKVSNNQAIIIFTHGDGSTTTYDLNFTSPVIASGTWIEAEGNAYMTGTVEIVLTLSTESNYAPNSLVGKTIYIPEEGFVANYSFTDDEAYYVIPLSLDQVEGIPYSYVATSTTATLTLARETGDVIHQITFFSPTTADSNWTDLESNETGSATLQILTEDYWPSTLAGWSYQGTSMNDTFYFVDEGHAVFYDASDSNFSNRELSNITYTWEQIGPRIGKLTTSLYEETLLFFESNTSGFFDWEEIGSDDGSSGKFDLFYYPSGKAFESLVGSSITIGDTTYVFTSTNAVTVHSPSGTSSLEYAYLRENEDEALLSVGSSLYKLDFYNHQYGRIIEGGSGYFSIHQNWATKGWVYYDELPWIYSNNQGEWMYQVLSNNNATNETELLYYEPWANVWAQNLDLNYTDQRVFSADTEFYWEDYDDFSGSSLDTNKWGSKYLGGGIEPYVSGGKLILSANSGNPSATKVVKSGWEDIFQGDDGGQAWVYPKDTDIVGIEAEFLIPSSTSSMSGLALGVASLSPLSYATAELNADPNSDSKYAQGFGFYHLTNDGSEVENFGTTQRDTTHRLGATLIDGVIKLYVDGEIRYQGEAGTFNTDMFYINGFNDYNSNGLPFVLNADNVRVLRKKSYPQGWMWTEYYPWAYSYETGGWLYFELAKDSAGNPVMNYYDHNSGSWDLYGPSLNEFSDR
jgi:hypothetical protein